MLLFIPRKFWHKLFRGQFPFFDGGRSRRRTQTQATKEHRCGPSQGFTGPCFFHSLEEFKTSILSETPGPPCVTRLLQGKVFRTAVPLRNEKGTGFKWHCFDCSWTDSLMSFDRALQHVMGEISTDDWCKGRVPRPLILLDHEAIAMIQRLRHNGNRRTKGCQPDFLLSQK